MSEPFRLDGMIWSHGDGHRGAGDNLARFQKRLLIEHIPEIEDCFNGTINVKLNVPLYVSRPDLTTPPIEWRPGTIEQFSFLRVKFTCPRDAAPIACWLIIPHDSPHRADAQSHEILAPRLSIADRYCSIMIEQQHRVFRLPYAPHEIVLVE